MTPAPKRRWSFSLRTLFVAVAILGIAFSWIAYELKWIRDRHAFRAKQLWSAESGHDVSKEDAAETIAGGWPSAYHSNAPGMLGLFGEYGLKWLYISVPRHDVRGDDDSSYSISVNHPEVRAASRLFPEAEIKVYWWDKAIGESHLVKIQH
jgi:hypothetical protein